MHVSIERDQLFHFPQRDTTPLAQLYRVRRHAWSCLCTQRAEYCYIVREDQRPIGLTSLLTLLALALPPTFPPPQDSIQAHFSSFSASHPSSVLGAVVLEPVLMGAAGMVWVDPLWQRMLIQEAQSRGMVVVLDEIASGLYRLGTPSAAELLQVGDGHGDTEQNQGGIDRKAAGGLGTFELGRVCCSREKLR